MTHRIAAACRAFAVIVVTMASAGPAAAQGPATLNVQSVALTSTNVSFVGLLTNISENIVLQQYVLTKARVYDRSWNLITLYNNIPYYYTIPISIYPGSAGTVSDSGVFPQWVDVGAARWTTFELNVIWMWLSGPWAGRTSSSFVEAYAEVPEPSSLAAVLAGAGCLGRLRRRGARRW